MKTTHILTLAGALMAGLMLQTACSTMGDAAPVADKETIAYSIGHCRHFCPIYSLEVTPSGHVTFTGQSHTVVIGKLEREAGVSGYRGVASALRPYRPADGTTSQTPQCEVMVSEQANYNITWTKPDGTRTVLDHSTGCMSPLSKALNKVLDAIPRKLGVADWAERKS